MKATTVRRTLMILMIILWSACYLLWKETKLDNHMVIPTVKYKVRAYTLTEKEAQKILSIGKSLGTEGTISRGTKQTRKLIGYHVVQNLNGKKDSKEIKLVQEYLKNLNLENSIIYESNTENIVTLQVGGTYKTPKEAARYAQEINNRVSINFEVKQQFENVTYKTFVIVFSPINSREQAVDFVRSIEHVTKEVEMVSF